MTDVYERFRLTGRTAVVTGAAGWLGAEFCKALAAAGARVAALDLEAERAENVAEQMRASGSEAIAAAADVTDPASLHRAISRIEERLGDVGILVNSAALDPKFDPAHHEAATQAFEDFPLTVWDRALKVNLTGVFLATQAVVPSMLRQRKGAIVNIASTYGLSLIHI